jgi:hypothetical protein
MAKEIKMASTKRKLIFILFVAPLVTAVIMNHQKYLTNLREKHAKIMQGSIES